MSRQVVRLASPVPLSRAPPSRTRTVFRGDSELASSAFGQLSGLFYLNIPKCVKQKEDDQISLIVETLDYMNDEEHGVRFRYP